MKAITTKYYGPTNTRGSRIRATDHDGHSVTVPYDYSKSHTDVHAVAALALCKRMNWTGELIAGHTNDGCVFVFANSTERYAIGATNNA